LHATDCNGGLQVWDRLKGWKVPTYTNICSTYQKQFMTRKEILDANLGNFGGYLEARSSSSGLPLSPRWRLSACFVHLLCAGGLGAPPLYIWQLQRLPTLGPKATAITIAHCSGCLGTAHVLVRAFVPPRYHIDAAWPAALILSSTECLRAHEIPVQAGTAVVVTGTSAFTAVQWALGALLYEKNVAGKATPAAASDPAGCLKSQTKDVMFYYRRQMRCVLELDTARISSARRSYLSLAMCSDMVRLCFQWLLAGPAAQVLRTSRHRLPRQSRLIRQCPAASWAARWLVRLSSRRRRPRWTCAPACAVAAPLMLLQ
jgi:hypothetical protein